MRRNLKDLKTTKCFVHGIWYMWDCFSCGGTNSNEYANPRVVGNSYFRVTCHHCGTEKKLRFSKEILKLVDPLLYHEDSLTNKKRQSKLGRIRKKYMKKLHGIWKKEIKDCNG